MSTTNQNNDSTSVEEVEINLDEILGTPGAENVMLPDTDGKKTEAKPKYLQFNFTRYVIY